MGKYKINNRTGKFDLVGKEGGGTDTPIVTEQRNGLETSLDKRLADHSYNNIMVLEKTFATPEDASDFLCSLDDQYYPIAGQIMQFTDTKGDKHIVRYTGSYKIRRDGVANAWGDVVWDSINGCYFTYQKATTDVITYGVNYNSSFWNIHDLSTQKKNWRYCAADDRLGVIIVAGNNATEYITSTDAFKTYSLKSGRSGYHTNVKGRDAVVNGVKERRFITITSSGNMPMDDIYIDALKASGNYDELYNAKSLITSSHVGYRNCTDFDINVRNNVNDLFFVWMSNDLKCYLSWYSDGSKISTIELPNTVSKVYYEEGKLYCYIGDYGRPTGGFDAYVIGIDYANNSLAIERTFADTHSILNTKYGIVALRHKQINLEGEEIELPVELGQYEILTTMTTNGEDCLMVVTGNHTAEDGYKGNYGFLVDLKKKKIINVERWEEIPLIPDGIEGVLRVSGNKVEELKLSERLEITDGTLDVKTSDRTTAYKSYRLGASGDQTFAEVWTKKKRNELAVGQTVYSDEDCTTAAGTISQVGNLNNPDDIVVTMTAGGDDVYHYSSILYPQTVASTKAVVDLWEKLGKRIGSVVTVDAGGNGDYTSLRDAMDNAEDTSTNPVTIIVYPGKYVMPTWTTITKFGNRYLNIVGIDRNNTIVENDGGNYVDWYNDDTPIRLAGNCTVENLTVISKSTDYTPGGSNRCLSYCIHIDYNAPAGSRVTVKNCRLINDHYACLGVGLRKDTTLEVIGCEFDYTLSDAAASVGGESAKMGAILIHDGGDGGYQKAVIKDCVFICRTNGTAVWAKDSLGTRVDVDIINCTMDFGIGNLRFVKNAFIGNKSHGNNIKSSNYGLYYDNSTQENAVRASNLAVGDNKIISSDRCDNIKGLVINYVRCIPQRNGAEVKVYDVRNDGTYVVSTIATKTATQDDIDRGYMEFYFADHTMSGECLAVGNLDSSLPSILFDANAGDEMLYTGTSASMAKGTTRARSTGISYGYRKSE